MSLVSLHILMKFLPSISTQRCSVVCRKQTYRQGGRERSREHVHAGVESGGGVAARWGAACARRSQEEPLHLRVCLLQLLLC